MTEEILKKLANNKEIYLRIRTVPRSVKTEFIGFFEDGSLKIAVSAAPEQGKANKELIKFLTRELVKEKVKISIVSGAGARIKLLKIAIV